MNKVNLANKKISKVMMNLFTDDPMLYGALVLVGVLPDKDQKTLGVNSKSTSPFIGFNPNFVNSLSYEQLELVMVTEGFKLMLRHPTSRLLQPANISSVSSNITVNQLLNHNFANIEGLDLIEDMASEMGLKNDQSFEEYFRNLMDMRSKTEDKMKQLWSKGEPKEGDGEGGGSGETQTDEDGYEEFSGSGDALTTHSDPNGTNNDFWGPNELMDGEYESYMECNSESTENWGKYTKGAIGGLLLANKPKTHHKEILKRFNTSVQRYDSVTSRMKVNRRYGMALPGYRRKSKSNVIFAIDTSGSMTDEEIRDAMGICNSMVRHSKIEYVMFDTEITHIEKDYTRPKESFHAVGRGGTDFQMVCDYADDKKVDGLVIFTDGYANAPTEPKTKVLWLLTNGDCKPPVDWGFRTHIEKYT